MVCSLILDAHILRAAELRRKLAARLRFRAFVVTSLGLVYGEFRCAAWILDKIMS